MTSLDFSANQKMFAATIKHIVPVREDIKVLSLQPLAPFPYQAGQFIRISFGGLPVRPYSIANAPGDDNDVLEIHIRRGKGAASAYVMDTLKIGEDVSFSGPEGKSVYDETISGPILALAGGLGIAPLKAVAEDRLERQGNNDVFKLYWGAVNESEHYLDDYFKSLAKHHDRFSFKPVTGHGLIAAVENDFEDLSDWQIFLSGPPGMIAALLPLVREKGVDPSHIHYDRHPEATGLKLD